MSKEKQEADRLIELFSVAQFEVGDIKHNSKLAKACAAICVKEIIADINNPDTHLSFWDKVLNEINKQ